MRVPWRLGGRVSQAEGMVGAQALRLEHSELRGEEAGGMGADHLQPRTLG